LINIREKKRLTFFIFNRIHPTALATFAETTGGLALLSNLSQKQKAILISIKMEVSGFFNNYGVCLYLLLFVLHSTKRKHADY
jgi:hypothetical protein